MGRGHLHALRDFGSANVESTSEDVWETQNIVDLVRVIGAPSRDDCIIAHFEHLFGKNLRIGVRQREYQWARRHRGDHLTRNHPASGETEEDISSIQRLSQTAISNIARECSLVRIQLACLLARLRQNPLRIAHQEILRRNPKPQIMSRTGDRRSTGSRNHHFDLRNLLLDHLQGIQQRRTRDYRSSMLIIVHHRNVQLSH